MAHPWNAFPGNLGAGHRLRLGIVNAMLLVACFRSQLRYSMCFCVVGSDLLDCAQHKNLADFLLAGVTHESVAERFTNTAEEVVAFLLCEVLLVALRLRVESITTRQLSRTATAPAALGF